MLMSAEIVQKVSLEIAGLTGLQIEACTIDRSGYSGRGFRIANFPIGRGIQVALGRTMSMSFAEVFPEDSAGALVRSIGRGAQDNPEVWNSVTNSGATGYEVTTFVNDEIVEPGTQAPDGLWRSFAMEFVKRENLVTQELVINSLSGVGAAAISSVVAFLAESEAYESGLGVGDGGLPEGASVSVLVNRYERNPLNRQRCIAHFGARCWVCEMDFESVYGDWARGYIEVHHRVPVSKLGGSYVLDPIRDLIPLCSNCHSAVHRRNPPFSPSELRKLMNLPDKVLPASTLDED